MPKPNKPEKNNQFNQIILHLIKIVQVKSSQIISYLIKIVQVKSIKLFYYYGRII